MLNSFIGSQNKVPYYINECKIHNINVLKPDINRSFAKFTVSGKDILFGLAAIKNVGIQAIENITREREQNGNFKSFVDFCERIYSEAVNKRCIESLIMAGAFDSLNDKNRNTLLSSFEFILDTISQDMKQKMSGQVNIFDIQSSNNSVQEKYIFNDREELPKNKLLSMEKEMLGLYVSGHPLENYSTYISLISNINSLEIANLSMEEENIETSDLKDGEAVRFICLISGVKTKSTKNGDTMAFLTCEDLDGQIDVICFPKTFSYYRNIIFEDAIVYIDGRLNLKEDDDITISASKIKLLSDENEVITLLNDIYQKNGKRLKYSIQIPEGLSEEKLKKLRELIKDMGKTKGNTVVNIINKDVSKEMFLNVDSQSIGEIRNIIGYDNLIIN